MIHCVVALFLSTVALVGGHAEPIVETSTLKFQMDSAPSLDHATQTVEGPAIELSTMTWAVSQSEVERFIQDLPTTYPSLVLRNLARAFLNTGFEIPPPHEGHGTILLARAQKLAALGVPEDARALLEPYHSLHQTPLYQELRFMDLLVAGAFEDALKSAKHHVQESPGSSFWQEALLVTQLLTHQDEAAALTLSVMEESASENPARQDFLAAVHLFLRQGAPHEWESLQGKSLLAAILASSLEDGIPDGLWNKLPPSIKGYFEDEEELSLTITPQLIEDWVKKAESSGAHEDDVRAWQRIIKGLMVAVSAGIDVPASLLKKAALMPLPAMPNLSWAQRALIKKTHQDGHVVEALASLLTYTGRHSDLWSPETAAFVIEELRALGLTRASSQMAALIVRENV